MTSKPDKRDFGMAMAMLFEAFAVKPEDASVVRIRVYEDGLKDVPLPLLQAAVRKAIATRTFFPKVAELRADAEACRHELIAAHPWQACVDCEDHPKWQAITGRSGETRLTRCGCWLRHQLKLAQLGVTTQPLALPAAREMSRVGEIE